MSFSKWPGVKGVWVWVGWDLGVCGWLSRGWFKVIPVWNENVFREESWFTEAQLLRPVLRINMLRLYLLEWNAVFSLFRRCWLHETPVWEVAQRTSMMTLHGKSLFIEMQGCGCCGIDCPDEGMALFSHAVFTMWEYRVVPRPAANWSLGDSAQSYMSSCWLLGDIYLILLGKCPSRHRTAILRTCRVGFCFCLDTICRSVCGSTCPRLCRLLTAIYLPIPECWD